MKNHSFGGPFRKKAKSQGFLTRAAYKLIQVDKNTKYLNQMHLSWILVQRLVLGFNMQHRGWAKWFVIGIDINQ